MNSPEQTPESRPARERRVGTFTFGAVLVICGALMLVSMFFPSLDLTLASSTSTPRQTKPHHRAGDPAGPVVYPGPQGQDAH